MPSTPERPSKVPMWKGVILAYFIVAICYFPVALIGYYVFGNSVDDNVLITLQKPAWLIAAANIFVFVHVIGGYQVRVSSLRCRHFIVCVCLSFYPHLADLTLAYIRYLPFPSLT